MALKFVVQVLVVLGILCLISCIPTMTLLDDIALIRQFVKGETALAANQNLRVESAFNTLQLFAKRRGLIATAQLSDGEVKTVLARADSEYWGLLHQVAQEHGLMPSDQQDQAGWMKYEHRPIPPGYQVNYTEARLLWKEWWVRSRQSPSRSIELNLLIFVAKRQQWYPIREIVCHEGTLYIKTLVAELMLLGGDSIVWLVQAGHKEKPAQSEKTTIQPAASPPTVEQNADMTGTTSTPTNGAPPVATSPRSPAGNTPSPSATAAVAKLRGVLRVKQNRLYIQTPAGEVVIEGTNMRFWLNGDESELRSRVP